MTDYPYEPPERMFSDTMLAFRDFELASTWGVRVEADPLGPVNKIVRLMHGGKSVRGALWPVPAGAVVRLARDDGAWTLRNLSAFRDVLWDSRGTDKPEPTIDIRPRGWRIEVDGIPVRYADDYYRTVVDWPAWDLGKGMIGQPSSFGLMVEGGQQPCVRVVADGACGKLPAISTRETAHELALAILELSKHLPE